LARGDNSLAQNDKTACRNFAQCEGFGFRVTRVKFARNNMPNFFDKAFARLKGQSTVRASWSWPHIPN
jgi:hypothetical protein